MEKWLMICSDIILDSCLASSKNEASDKFKNRSRYEDWSESDIISEADYLIDLKNESEINPLKNQSYEG